MVGGGGVVVDNVTLNGVVVVRLSSSVALTVNALAPAASVSGTEKLPSLATGTEASLTVTLLSVSGALTVPVSE